jgi:hypothetical protein
VVWEPRRAFGSGCPDEDTFTPDRNKFVTGRPDEESSERPP